MENMALKEQFQSNLINNNESFPMNMFSGYVEQIPSNKVSHGNDSIRVIRAFGGNLYTNDRLWAYVGVGRQRDGKAGFATDPKTAVIAALGVSNGKQIWELGREKFYRKYKKINVQPVLIFSGKEGV